MKYILIKENNFGYINNLETKNPLHKTPALGFTFISILDIHNL